MRATLRFVCLAWAASLLLLVGCAHKTRTTQPVAVAAPPPPAVAITTVGAAAPRAEEPPPPPPPPPPPAPTAEKPADAGAKVEYKKKSTIDFKDETVEGDLKKPDARELEMIRKREAKIKELQDQFAEKFVDRMAAPEKGQKAKASAAAQAGVLGVMGSGSVGIGSVGSGSKSSAISNVLSEEKAAEANSGSRRSPSDPHTGISLADIGKVPFSSQSGASGQIEGSASPEARDYVRNILGNLQQGKLVWNPPTRLQYDRVERVQVRISQNLVADLKSGVEGPGEAKQELVSVGTFMAVKLEGEGFDIHALNTESQPITDDPRTVTEWNFDVKPTATGTHKLQLRVSVLLKMPDGDTEQYNQRLREQPVEVWMSFGQSLTSFLKEWGILLVTLLGAIPGIYFAWSKLIRRRGDAPAPAPQAAPVPTIGKAEGELAEAYVLFTDIVGYSKHPMETQRELIQKLQQIIGAIPEYENALGQQRVIAIPTGDGMALAFFQAPDAPVRCAIAVARILRQHPEIKLRMGINSGPVYRVLDINRQLNVSGAGINMAQRVMDCGDAGHILVSRSTAEILREFSEWKGSLVDLGEAEVKHGVKVHIFNLLGEGYGNAETPAKLKVAKAAGG